MNIRIFSPFVLLTLLLGCSSEPNTGEKNKLSAREFADQLQASEDAVIIDVRTPEEYAGGHIEQARNMDWNNPDFGSQAATLDHSKPVFIYCLSGGRSAAAAAELRKKALKPCMNSQAGCFPGGRKNYRKQPPLRFQRQRRSPISNTRT